MFVNTILFNFLLVKFYYYNSEFQQKIISQNQYLNLHITNTLYVHI